MLLLAGALTLSGCRKDAPPSPPRHGWVRLDTLAALHPNMGMVADMDRQLAALSTQRQRLLAQPALASAPVSIDQPVPSLPAVTSPAPTPLTPSPTPLVHAQDLEALRRSLTHQREREFLRKERELKAAAASELKRTLAQLDEDADVHRRRVAEEYRLAITAANIRQDAAERRKDSLEVQVYEARQKAAVAEKAKETQVSYAQAHPKDDRAQRRAAEQTRWAEIAARSVAQLDADFKEAVARVASLNRELAEQQEAMDNALKKIDSDLAAAQQAAEEKQQKTVTARISQLRKDITQEITRQVAKEAARLEVDAQREQAAETAPSITSPEVPGSTLTLETGDVQQGVHDADTARANTRLTALQVVERSITALQTQRRQALAAIRTDTRALAVTLAAQRGYLLSIDRKDGRDLTAQMTSWLRSYWPQETTGRRPPTNAEQEHPE